MIGGGCLSTAGVWQEVGLGVVLVMLASLTMSFQFVLGKNLVGGVHPGIMVFYRAAIASAMMFLWVAGPGEARFDVRSILLGDDPVWSVSGSLRRIHAAVSLLPRFWDVTRTAMVMTLQPLFVLPLGLLFLPEQGLSTRQLLGGVADPGRGALVDRHSPRPRRESGHRVPVTVPED